MANLTGVLQADFSDFYTAVTTAETHLKSFEDGAGKVEKSLNRMVDQFSGRKLIQDATLAAQAIERLGGASKLTEKELARAAAQAAEAAEKMRALGMSVPPEIEKLAHAVKEVGDETAQVTIQTDGLTGKYKDFDGALSSVGINIGRQVRGLEELQTAASGSATGLTGVMGSLAKGLAVLGAIKLAWDIGQEIGKTIDKFTGLSTAIEKATVSLMGWKTEAGGAGSATDTLARASVIAGRNITDFNEAVVIIRKNITDLQAVAMRAQGPAIMAERVAKYHQELSALSKAGVLDDVTRLMEEGIISTAELSRQFHVSAEALGILRTQIQEKAKADDTAAAATKKHEDAIAAQTAKIVALQSEMFGKNLIDQAHQYARALGDVSNVSKLLPGQQEALAETFRKAAEQLERLGKGGTAAHTEFRMMAAALAPLPELFGKLIIGAAGLADALPKVSIDWTKEAAAINAANQSLIPPIQDATDGWSVQARAVSAAMTAYAEVQPEIDKTKEATAGATAANRELAASFTIVGKSAAEWRAQAIGLRLDAERMERSGGGNSTTMWQTQYIENLRKGAANAEASAGRQSELDRLVGGIGAPWGGGGGWTINVNASQGINGEQIANELVSGMRRRGISPGGL